ncbi:hypothetical protein M0R45_030419 [Rubus argutus]|uniref:Uncharacterized protein n=1 Tax=Rubus argutus TaxID=59490 RepID=A0AAW1WBS4_RUBAR
MAIPQSLQHGLTSASNLTAATNINSLSNHSSPSTYSPQILQITTNHKSTAISHQFKPCTEPTSNNPPQGLTQTTNPILPPHGLIHSLTNPITKHRIPYLQIHLPQRVHIPILCHQPEPSPQSPNHQFCLHRSQTKFTTCNKSNPNSLASSNPTTATILQPSANSLKSKHAAINTKLPFQLPRPPSLISSLNPSQFTTTKIITDDINHYRRRAASMAALPVPSRRCLHKSRRHVTLLITEPSRARSSQIHR